MSIPFGNPNSRISLLSFSNKTGRSTLTPGKFIFFLSPNLASFNTSTLTDFSKISLTSQTNEPSAIKIYEPTFTDVQSFAYEHAIF